MSADYLSNVGLSLVRQCETRTIKIAKQIGVEIMFYGNFRAAEGYVQSHKRNRLLSQL